MQAMEVLCRGILECQGAVASVERLQASARFKSLPVRYPQVMPTDGSLRGIRASRR
jgi:hypothetical protein